VSEHTHAAVGRAWRVLGFEPAHLRILRPDTAHRLSVAAVEAAVAIDRAAHLEPFCLVATAGNTSTGAVDPLADLAGFAAREGLWFHIDGAYGAPVRLTDRGRDLLTGIEHADSLVLDPHKWLFQPYEIGAVLVREPGLLERTFALEHGVYLRDTGGGAVEFRERSPLLTRSSRALKLWLSLQVFGLDAFRAGIAHGIAIAEYAEALLRERGGWEIVSPATLAIVCFRREGHDDEQTDALVRAVVADGYAAPSTTVLDGHTVARLCTINPRTTEDDIRGTIERLERFSGC
jgi:glutamate/tyrosine decarboxylase-like PLP-dependent enzyme